MPPTWADLELHHVDVHLHAGTERPEPYSLLDVVGFAVATGRRIIGLTDHFGRFLGLSRKPLAHYPGSLDGFRQFAADVREARHAFPDVHLLFGPETGFSHLWSGESAAAFSCSEVDFFLGEPGAAPDGTRYGDYLVRGVEAIAACRDRFGRPGVLAHPLRHAINTICGKTPCSPSSPTRWGMSKSCSTWRSAPSPRQAPGATCPSRSMTRTGVESSG